MINVLHLRSSFEPGGTETSIFNLFHTDQDCFCMHLALLRHGQLVEALESNKNKYYKWYRKRYIDFKVIKRMLRLIKTANIQIIHTHQLIELIYAVICKIRYPKIKLIYHNHIMFVKKDWAFFVERFLSQHFTYIITVSDAARSELINKYRFKSHLVHVLYNGIPNFTRKENSLQVLNTLLDAPLDPNRLNIVMVANFVWGKDHETVFKAYNEAIREKLPNVCLYFVGRITDLTHQLSETYLNDADLSNHRIVFCGTIPNAKQYISNFDGVIMSSFSETFNQSLVEAAFLGLPILASDIAIFKELSADGRYFDLFNVGDVDDFIDKFSAFTATIKNGTHESHATYFRNQYSFKKFVDNHCKMYKSIAAPN